MIEAFEIGVSLAVDSDDAQSTLTGLGRQLSGLDRSIDQTHRRISDMRASLATMPMPDETLRAARSAEREQRFLRPDAGMPGAGGHKTAIDAMEANGSFAFGRDVALGQVLEQTSQFDEGTVNAGEFHSLTDLIAATDRQLVVSTPSGDGQDRREPFDPVAPDELTADAVPRLGSAGMSLGWSEDGLSDAAKPLQESIARPEDTAFALDLPGVVSRIGAVLSDAVGAGPDLGTVNSAEAHETDGLSAHGETVAGWPFESGSNLSELPRISLDGSSPPSGEALQSSVWPNQAWDSGPDAMRSVAYRASVPGEPVQQPELASVNSGSEASARRIEDMTPIEVPVQASQTQPDRTMHDIVRAMARLDAGTAWPIRADAPGDHRPYAGDDAAAAPRLRDMISLGLPLQTQAVSKSGVGEASAGPSDSGFQLDVLAATLPGEVAMPEKPLAPAVLPPAFAPRDNVSPRVADEVGGRGQGRPEGATDDRGSDDRPIVVHTNVQIDGDVVARAVTHRMVASLNGPLAGSGGFDQRRSYTPVES